MNAPESTPVRLTRFSHGGGCGCKIAPALLQQIVAKAGTAPLPELARIPVLPGVDELIGAGIATGASARNWAGYAGDVEPPGANRDAVRALLTDPQTSGGLLVACAPDAVDAVLAVFRDEGFDRAAMIGTITADAARVTVR